MKGFKLFGLIHLADILWVMLIVLIILAASIFSMPREANARQGNATIRFTIELGERRTEGGNRILQPAGFHENIRIGEPIFDSVTGIHIGTIVDVYALPYKVEAFDEAAGIIRRTEVEGLEYVYIVVEAPATISEYETLVGNFPVSVGRGAYVRSKYFAGAGYIILLEIL